MRDFATRAGMYYDNFRYVCNSSEVGIIFCDGLKFAICVAPEWCSSELTFKESDTETDQKIANVWRSLLLNPGPGTTTQAKLFFTLWRNNF